MGLTAKEFFLLDLKKITDRRLDLSPAQVEFMKTNFTWAEAYMDLRYNVEDKLIWLALSTKEKPFIGRKVHKKTRLKAEAVEVYGQDLCKLIIQAADAPFWLKKWAQAKSFEIQTLNQWVKGIASQKLKAPRPPKSIQVKNG